MSLWVDPQEAGQEPSAPVRQSPHPPRTGQAGPAKPQPPAPSEVADAPCGPSIFVFGNSSSSYNGASRSRPSECHSESPASTWVADTPPPAPPKSFLRGSHQSPNKFSLAPNSRECAYQQGPR